MCVRERERECVCVCWVLLLLFDGGGGLLLLFVGERGGGGGGVENRIYTIFDMTSFYFVITESNMIISNLLCVHILLYVLLLCY